MELNKVKMESMNVIMITVVVLLLMMVHIPTTFTLIIPNTLEQSSNAKNATKAVPFTEYFIDHNISQSDAKKSFFEVGVKLLEDEPTQPWCMPCTPESKRYCSSERLWDDHCCCEQKHGSDRLPWIPHSCYVSENCRPSTNSCITYVEILDCCCKRVLAKEWYSIHSSSMKTPSNVVIQLVCVTIALIAPWVKH